MTDRLEDTIKFIADQILKLGGEVGRLGARLDAIEGVQRDIRAEVSASRNEVKGSLGLIQGWMDGQEAITERSGEKLTEIVQHLNRMAEMATTHAEKLDHTYDEVVAVKRKIGGLEELSKSAFDVATQAKTYAEQTKGFVEKLLPGGEHEQPAEEGIARPQ